MSIYESVLHEISIKRGTDFGQQIATYMWETESALML